MMRSLGFGLNLNGGTSSPADFLAQGDEGHKDFEDLFGNLFLSTVENIKAASPLDLPEEIQLRILASIVILPEEVHLKFFHHGNERRLVQDSFKPPRSRTAATVPGWDMQRKKQTGRPSYILNLMLVDKIRHDQVKEMLYAKNVFLFHSSESVVKLNELSSAGYGNGAMAFLTHIKIVLENQTSGSRIATALASSYKLQSVVLIHKRDRKCAFASSASGYSADTLAKDMMPLVKALQSFQSKSTIESRQCVITLEGCDSGTCENTRQGRGVAGGSNCCSRPACAIAHIDFQRSLFNNIAANNGLAT